VVTESRFDSQGQEKSDSLKALGSFAVLACIAPARDEAPTRQLKTLNDLLRFREYAKVRAMLGRIKILPVGLLVLVLQMGLAHAVQHDLHDFNPSNISIEHDESDCLQGDTPHAKSALPFLGFSFARAENQTSQAVITRHTKRLYKKASPRAPPAFL